VDSDRNADGSVTPGRTWNPTRGCSRVSPGCVNCYAEALAGRYSAYGAQPGSPFAGFVTKVNGHASWTGKVELVESMLDTPLHWRKPCRVFVNSMSDLFHEALPDEAIDRVFAVMALARHHSFQILTKRAARMDAYVGGFHHRADEFVNKLKPSSLWNGNACEAHRILGMGSPLPNVWLGVSVEDQQRKDRIDMLRQTPAAVRFLSIEPLIEDIGVLDLSGISWVIVGGESGPGARPFYVDWARNIIEQCKAAGVPVFMKQVGRFPNGSGFPDFDYRKRDRKGGTMEEWPEDLRVREFPSTPEAK
jgi:protein gp37